MRSPVLLCCFILLQRCDGRGVAQSAPNTAPTAGRSLGEGPAGAPVEQVAVEKNVSLPTAIAWNLFGGVLMIMGVFYLINWKDEDIVSATWLVMSNAISLFCAVLLFLAFREAVALMTDGDDIQDRRLGAAGDANWGQCWSSDSGQRRLSNIFGSRRLAGVPTQTTLSVDAGCFVFVFVCWEITLFLIRKRQELLAALGLIAGHCIGFSTLYAFGNMQQCEPFRDSPGRSLAVAVIALAGFLLACFVADLVRTRLAPAHDGHVDRDTHNWLHQCKHTEREALAFGISFLLAQVLEFCATEDIAPLHAVPKGKSLADARLHVCFVVGLSVLVMLIGYVENGVAAHHGHEELTAQCKAGHAKHGHEMTRTQLFLHMLKDTVGFTIGWTLLVLIKIIFWSTTDDNGVIGDGDIMTSHTVVVIISSAVTFATFFCIDFAADRIHGNFARGLRALGKAYMLLLGLAWEGAFWEGAHSIAVGMNLDHRSKRMLSVIGISLAFCGLVMPAWILYIVPRTIEMHDGELHVKDYDDHASPKGSSGVRGVRSGESVRGVKSSDKSPLSVVAAPSEESTAAVELSQAIEAHQVHKAPESFIDSIPEGDIPALIEALRAKMKNPASREETLKDVENQLQPVDRCYSPLQLGTKMSI